MYYFAMDVGWKRVPMLLILLIFLKHAFGEKGWSSHDVLPHQRRHDYKIASPWGVQSSVLEAPVTGSIPFEEVASNVLAKKSLIATRPCSSISCQSVKGGTSSSHASMFPTRSAPSSSVSASLALPQNLLAASHQYVPTLESSSGSSSQPQGTTSQYAPVFSLGAKVPVSSQYYPATLSGSSQSLSQSSPKWQPSTSKTNVFQPSSKAVLQGFQTSGASQSTSQYPSRFVSLSSASADGSSLQLQGTSSQKVPASLGSKVPPYKPAAPSGSSSLSQPSQWQPSTSRWSQGFQASGTVSSQSSSPTQGSKSTLTSAASPGKLFSTQDGSGRYSGLFSQSQSASSQYAPASLVSKVPLYKPAAPSGSSSLSQPSQWQPSTSRWSQGFQASGTVSSQSSSPTQGSKSTLTSAASPGKLFSTQDGSGRYSGLFSQSQSASSQYAPASLVSKVPLYKPAAPSGSSLSQLSQWQPSTSRWSQGFQASGTVASQGFQTSGTVTSQSSSPTQGSKSTSRLSTVTSAASPGRLFSPKDGSGRYSGLFSQSQSASSQYAPASLVSKVPPYKPAAPSGSSLSQLSQWQPSTSMWSQDFQASGTVASQSSSPSQGSKSTSRLSTLTTAVSPGKTFSTHNGIVRYSGLSSQSQSASIQHNPGSPAYAKHGFSLLDSSRQSTSGSSSMAALSLPVDSVAQSSSSNSWRTSSLSGVGFGPSMLSSKAASGSISRQVSPGLVGSVQHPTDSTHGQKLSWRDFLSTKG